MSKLCVAIITLMFLPASLVFAEDQFTADYNISYNVNSDGITQVEHKVSITNLKDDAIATNYSLNLKQLEIYDVSAADNHGKLEVTQTATGDQTSLNIKIKAIAVGVGRQTSLTIFYKSNQIATKTGEIWNINIPRSQTASPTTTNSVTLIVPVSFGPKIYVSPTPAIESNEKIVNTFSFASESLKDKTISASFGKYQTINFRVRYQITNPNLFTSNYEIALLPTIRSSQLVAYQNLTPKPQRTYLDSDGNYMAVYRLKPKQNLEIELLGSAQITSEQIDPVNGGLLSKISGWMVNSYTKSQNFWETKNPEVKKVATELYDPQLNITQNANKIYDFVVNNFSYDFSIAKKSFVDRMGAAKAINNKAGWGCMEFTDTFIAIARASGIPARAINGYAITASQTQKPISVTLKGGDLLHAWPEFYDPKLGWIQIDPTWGNTSNTDYFTKLDTGHLAFVIQGVKSDYPLPAGTYRANDTEKLVEVDYSQSIDKSQFIPQASIKKVFDWNIFDWLFGISEYEVTNTGKITIYDGSRALLPNHKFTIHVKKAAKQISLTDAFGSTFKLF